MRLKDGMAINCKTQEDAEVLLKECSKQGIKTFGGSDANKLGIKGANVWKQYKENTCYSIEKSCIFNGLKIEFSPIGYYKTLGYKITEFHELFKTDSKLKVGDKVKVKNDLIVGEIYGNITFLNTMDKYSGLELTIERISNEGNYALKNGKDVLYYSKEMLEKVKEEKKMSKCKIYEMPDYVGNEVKKVIINEPCVIVILNSGEKGVAKCCPEDVFNEERGYILALERARKEKYLNDVVRQDEVINQCLKIFDNDDMIKNYNKMISEFYHTK